MEWLRRVTGVEDGGGARRCARGQGGAGVLRASDLLESTRGVAAEVYKGSDGLGATGGEELRWRTGFT